MTKYIKVDWPESQNFVGKDGCYSVCTDPPLIFVPEELYNEVTRKLQFAKKYENTNLGTVVCYETRAIINGKDIYWYDESLIKRGSQVLVYDFNSDDWMITTCLSCAEGFPFILENKSLLPGINCEIIGVNISNEQ